MSAKKEENKYIKLDKIYQNRCMYTDVGIKIIITFSQLLLPVREHFIFQRFQWNSSLRLLDEGT